MHNDKRLIINHFFKKDSLPAISVDEIQEFLSRYPYAAPARYLLAQKIYDTDPAQAQEKLVTAGLYINNPLWLEWLLTNTGNGYEVEAPALSTGVQDEQQEISSGSGKAFNAGQETEGEEEPAESPMQEPIAFQSYHTIDYFASQGIRLQQAELARDKLGQQLKSFTEWLRSMKKLPAPEIESGYQGPEEVTRREDVILSAAHSLEDKEVLTEAMAEVWVKQGNHPKAIEIYQKLSLQNPGKSAYFAAKIDQLK